MQTRIPQTHNNNKHLQCAARRQHNYAATTCAAGSSHANGLIIAARATHRHAPATLLLAALHSLHCSAER